MNLLNTFSNLKRLALLFDKKDQKKIFKIFIMLFSGVVLEIIGLSLIAPVVSMLQGINYQGFIVFSLLGWDLNNFELIELLGLILIVILIKNIFQFFSNHFQNHVGFFFQNKLSKKVLSFYLNIDFINYMNINTADIINDVIKVINTVCQYTILPLFYLITELILVAGIFVYLLYFDFKTTLLIGFFFGSSLIIYNLIVGKKILRLGNIVMENDSVKIKQITENIMSYMTIKLGKHQSFFIKKFDRPNTKVSKSLALQFSLRQLPKYYFEFLLYSFLLLLVIIYDGNNQGNFITKIGVYIATLIKVVPSLNRITGAIQSIKFSESSIKRLVSLKFNKTKNGSTEQIKFTKGIFLEKITFSYNSDKIIIDDLNFSIPKNSVLGIIGQSGVGKSTLLNLLLGNLFPLSGKIKVDDKILNKNNIDSWHSKIGYVSQKIYLLDEPIVNNVAFGVPNDKIDVEKVKKVMQIAKISSLLDQFDILKDNLGENGSKLSGGQIQRLGLSRALYSDPEILLFDEFTSALDTKTESKILKDIEKLKSKKTIIFISHKKSVLRFCDQILDLNKNNS